MSLPSPFGPDSPAYARAVEVQRKFESWRRETPRGLRRISKELWDSAARLAVITSVCQVSKFLSLDFHQLKKCVIEKFGANSPALPRQYKRKASCESKTCRTHEHVPATPASTLPPDCPPGVQTARVTTVQSISASLPRPPLSEPSDGLGHDGFVDLPLQFPVQGMLGPPILAEIRSPTGCMLRLFSCETGPIIQAFLQQ